MPDSNSRSKSIVILREPSGEVAESTFLALFLDPATALCFAQDDNKKVMSQYHYSVDHGFTTHRELLDA